jgi:hypothetical protein
MTGAGPLIGLKVVEIGAIGPVTHAMMMLADLKSDEGRQLVLDLAALPTCWQRVSVPASASG